MADCERGLGRPERAIALAATPEAETLDPAAKVELAIVVSGARGDLGDLDAALAVLDQIELPQGDRTAAARVAVARSTVHEAAGRETDAAAALTAFTAEEIAAASGVVDDEDPVVVYDLVDELAPEVDESGPEADENKPGEDESVAPDDAESAVDATVAENEDDK
jgi:hypothetical protein